MFVVLTSFAFLAGRTRVLQTSRHAAVVAAGSNIVTISDSAAAIDASSCLAMNSSHVKVLVLVDAEPVLVAKTGTRAFDAYDFMGDLSVLDPNAIGGEHGMVFVGDGLYGEVGSIPAGGISVRGSSILSEVGVFDPSGRVELFDRRVFVPSVFDSASLCYLEALSPLQVGDLLVVAHGVLDGPQRVVRVSRPDVAPPANWLDSEKALQLAGAVGCALVLIMVVLLDRRESGLYRTWGYTRLELLGLRAGTLLVVVGAVFAAEISVVGLMAGGLRQQDAALFTRAALVASYRMLSLAFALSVLAYGVVSRRAVLRLLRD